MLLCPARAEQAGIVISADDQSFSQREAVVRGNVDIREADWRITADELRYVGDQQNIGETLTVSGNVVLTRGPLRMLARRVIYNRRDGSFQAEKVRVGSFPYYIAGESASGTREEVTVYKAQVSYGEPGPWQPAAYAEKITFSKDGRRISSDSAQVGVGNVRPLPFPKFQQSLSAPFLSFINLSGGYRGSLGAFLDGGIQLPVTRGLRLGADLAYFTKRGVLFGPAGSYFDVSDPDRLRGYFRSGYINDHGDKKTDVIGRPVPEDRGFAEWQHRQTLGDLTLTGQLHWWKDSEVVRDFRPRAFFPVQQPDSFIEATHAGTNTFASAFVRVAPNSFQIVQRRTPELRFDMLPLAFGGGFYERFNASIAMLKERPLPIASVDTIPVPANPDYIPAPWPIPPGSSEAGDFWLDPRTGLPDFTLGAARDLRTTRFDTYYAVMRPITPRDWLTITPIAGGRFTHYMNMRGGGVDGHFTRVLGELGVDAELKTSGTWAYKNETWEIDGLRHLFTPRISYRYIPRGDRGRGRIPRIDRQAFSTYLQPLGLGDVRNIDDLRATNTLRLGFDNTLQTRDPKYGSRDLLMVNVASDFRFKRRRGEHDVSAIHTEIAAMPTRWLEFGVYNSFTPQSSTLEEFNSGVTIRDGDLWSLRFSNSYLRYQLEDYMIDGRARLNEQFDVLAILRYDQRQSRFTEQSYGVVQNLANTWRISYIVSLYSGRRRESSFGFSVQVDTVRF